MDAKTDRVIGVILLAIAGFWAWQTALTDDPGIEGIIGPRLFPGLLSGLLAILALFLIAATIRRRSTDPSPGAASQAAAAAEAAAVGPQERLPILRTEIGAVSITMGLLLLYISALKYTGFLLSTPVLMFIIIRWLMGERSWVHALSVSIGMSVVVWFIFSKLFGVPLPVGKLLG